MTRPRALAEPFARRLESFGATVTICPAITIVDGGDAAFAVAMQNLLNYDRIIFTSANAVRAVLARIAGEAGRALPRVAAVGPQTAALLADAGITCDPLPDSADSEALLASLGDVAGERLLMPRSDLADAAFPDQCRASGATVDAPIAYRTEQSPELAGLAHLLRSGWIDALTLASASAARAVASVVVPTRLIAVDIACEARPAIFCIGPSTARAARDAGLPVDALAPTHDGDGLIEALLDWFATARC